MAHDEDRSVKTAKTIIPEQAMPWDQEPVVQPYTNFNGKQDLDNLFEYQVQADYVQNQNGQQDVNEPSNPIQEMLRSPEIPQPSQRNKSKPKKKSRGQPKNKGQRKNKSQPRQQPNPNDFSPDNDIFEGGQREPKPNSEIKPEQKSEAPNPIPSSPQIESQNSLIQAMASQTLKKARSVQEEFEAKLIPDENNLKEKIQELKRAKTFMANKQSETREEKQSSNSKTLQESNKKTLKKVTDQQRKDAFKFMMTVSVLKNANMDSRRKKEAFSNYEMKLIEEFEWPDQDQDKDPLQKALQLKKQQTLQRQQSLARQQTKLLESTPKIDYPYFCQKVHKLDHIRSRFDIPEYQTDARCDECDAKIVLDTLHKDARGFFHCKRCKYDICRKCTSRGLADISKRKEDLLSEPAQTTVSPSGSPLSAKHLFPNKEFNLGSQLHKISQESQSESD